MAGEQAAVPPAGDFFRNPKEVDGGRVGVFAEPFPSLGSSLKFTLCD
jgi:hypothetical protein